jgi:hypothetical protein
MAAGDGGSYQNQIEWQNACLEETIAGEHGEGWQWVLLTDLDEFTFPNRHEPGKLEGTDREGGRLVTRSYALQKRETEVFGRQIWVLLMDLDEFTFPNRHESGTLEIERDA